MSALGASNRGLTIFSCICQGEESVTDSTGSSVSCQAGLTIGDSAGRLDSADVISRIDVIPVVASGTLMSVVAGIAVRVNIITGQT